MNKFINKELENVLTKIKGQILCIGLNDEKLLDIIDENKNIIKCDILNNNSVSSGGDITKGPKSKTVSINNIKTIFGKKRINGVIVDYKHIEMYLRTFVKDSIYICSGNIILYGELKKEELDKVIELYNRYKIKSIAVSDKNNHLITFEINDKKTNKIKDLGYLIKDSIMDAIDIITDLLTA